MTSANTTFLPSQRNFETAATLKKAPTSPASLQAYGLSWQESEASPVVRTEMPAKFARSAPLRRKSRGASREASPQEGDKRPDRKKINALAGTELSPTAHLSPQSKSDAALGHYAVAQRQAANSRSPGGGGASPVGRKLRTLAELDGAGATTRMSPLLETAAKAGPSPPRELRDGNMERPANSAGRWAASFGGTHGTNLSTRLPSTATTSAEKYLSANRVESGATTMAEKYLLSSKVESGAAPSVEKYLSSRTEIGAVATTSVPEKYLSSMKASSYEPRSTTSPSGARGVSGTFISSFSSTFSPKTSGLSFAKDLHLEKRLRNDFDSKIRSIDTKYRQELKEKVDQQTFELRKDLEKEWLLKKDKELDIIRRDFEYLEVSATDKIKQRDKEIDKKELEIRNLEEQLEIKVCM